MVRFHVYLCRFQNIPGIAPEPVSEREPEGVWEHPHVVNGSEVTRPQADASDDSGYFDVEPQLTPHPVKAKPLGMESCE